MQAFLTWSAKFNKNYQTSEEFESRFSIFLQNTEEMYSQEEFLQDGHELELNKFADWTDDEYSNLLGFSPRYAVNMTEVLDEGDLPESINWVEEGVVSLVKDQGRCGSCWSFSTTGSMESAFQIKDGKARLLSEQQLVDCSISFGNNGCGGGLVEYAFNYATKHGLASEDEYPYTATDGTCKDIEGESILSSFKDVQRFSPTQLAAALQLGPVSIGVDASGFGFKFYKSGIISRLCGTSIDHAVLLVGYGTEKGKDYWLVKNSWASDWGENGYFRVLRDMEKQDEGMCGIQ